MSVVLIQASAQKTGNQLLWSAERSLLSWDDNPCVALQKHTEKQKLLPPASYAIWQACIQSQIYEFSAKILAQNLSRIVEPQFQVDGLSSEQLAIALYPQLQDRIAVLCTENRFPRAHCDEKQWQKSKRLLANKLIAMLQTGDDTLRLEVYQRACIQKDLARDIANAVKTKDPMHIMLKSCSLVDREAKEWLKAQLFVENPLLPLVLLETRRRKISSLRTDIEALRPEDELSKAMIDFSLQGL